MLHNTTTQSKQKICADLDHHWSKKAHFFVRKQTGFVHQRLRNFVKKDCDSSPESLIVTRVKSSYSLKNVTRVESPPFSTWLASSPNHQNRDSSRVDSLTHFTLHYYWTDAERFVTLGLPSWTQLRTRYWGVFTLQGIRRFASCAWPMVLRKLGNRWKWKSESWFHYRKVLFVGAVGIAETWLYLA